VLRPATAADARLLWLWRNDPAVRASALSMDVVPWARHCLWLETKLGSSDCRMWILEQCGQPVGHVRYDRVNADAEIDISIAAASRGAGLGRALLGLSAQAACHELAVKALVGIVKVDNAASIRAFEGAGFRRVCSVARKGQACIRLERLCSPAG
jgi:RimJ/RimL family protein N-acetyltransferase